MTNEEIKNTPELVDFMLDKSVSADSRIKVRKRLEEVCNMAIKALSTESCKDAISRQAVLDLCDMQNRYEIPYEYNEGGKHIKGYDEGRIINVTKLKVLPPVTPQPKTKTGRWKQCMPKGTEEWAYECSECNFWRYKKTINLSRFNFCPNCGARMESEE